MARKKANQQKESKPVLVHAVEGNGGGQGNGQKQVPEPGRLIAGLYELGAEIVMSLNHVGKLDYTVQFKGEKEPLELNLPAGHYIICRVVDPVSSKPGLQPVVNPRKK